MKLGVLLRAHQRAKTLDIALSEFFRYREFGIDVAVSIIADRPHFLVEKVLEKWRSSLFHLHYTKIPILGYGKQSWMENSNENLRHLERCNPDWIVFADDDRWFARPQIDEELPRALDDENVDLWYAKSLFLWDKPDQINARRHHDQVTIWRHTRGDRFPTDRVIQAPAGVHDGAVVAGRVGHLSTPLLDYGSYDAAERQRVYDSYVRAGRDKRDPWISTLVESPQLEKLPLKCDDLWSSYEESADA